MSQTTTPRRQIATRASNKAAHPGYPDRSKGRRTPAEVQQERTAKAGAKAAREKAREASINRTADFEVNDIVNEGLADATPRPPFTPKPPRNRTHSDELTPLPLRAKDSHEVSNDSDEEGSSEASFVPPGSEMTIDSSESAVESPPSPPPKKKVRSIGKGHKAATAAAAAIKVREKKKVLRARS